MLGQNAELQHLVKTSNDESLEQSMHSYSTKVRTLGRRRPANLQNGGILKALGCQGTNSQANTAEMPAGRGDMRSNSRKKSCKAQALSTKLEREYGDLLK